MKTENLPKSAIKIWRIRLTILTLFSTFVFGAVGVFNKKVALILIFITSIAYVYGVLFYCVDRYNSEIFHFDAQTLYITTGVYFKCKKAIFLDEVQYVKTVASPEQRVFGVCTLYFFSAGNRTKISQIEYKRALQVKNLLGFGAENDI